VRLRLLSGLLERPDVAIAHAFRKPPYGGSNQFLIALRGELQRRGLRVAANLVTRRTRACVINSYVFDERALRRMLHPGCRVVHRLDGPLSVYRGFDNGTDEYLSRANLELADVTVFQSRYSLDACRALGLEFREPRVIPNAVDPAIFHPPAAARAPLDGRPVRLITTSWSDNPNKGAATLARLEELLDPARFELTFVGRSKVSFRRIRVMPPVGSEQVAELLREHDAFVMPSRHESCSNALLEALACGLPAAYVASGGNAELVGEAGIPFAGDEDAAAAVERLADELEERRARVSIPSLQEVTTHYLEAMGL
jgi:glycosyltransferase involved in cell wall biosynthesis